MKEKHQIEDKLIECQNYKRELDMSCEHFISVCSDFNDGFMEGLKWVLNYKKDVNKSVKEFTKSMLSRSIRDIDYEEL